MVEHLLPLKISLIWRDIKYDSSKSVHMQESFIHAIVGTCLISLIFIFFAIPCFLSIAFKQKRLYSATYSSPIFVFATPAAWTQNKYKDTSREQGQSLHPQIDAQVEHALENLLKLILQNHVHDWLDRLTSPQRLSTFPSHLENLIQSILVSLINKSQGIDWTKVFVNRIVPILTKHVEHFKQVEINLKIRTAPNVESFINFDEILVANKFATLEKTGLHQAVNVASVDSRLSEEAYLREMSSKILPLILPSRFVRHHSGLHLTQIS